MSEPYATAAEAAALWRPLTAAETERANLLLPLISDLLRQAAANAGRDLDRMIEERPALASAAKLVTVDVLGRVLRQNTSGEPVSQETQTALGYTWQGTYAVPGGGIANAIMDRDLRRLGLFRQKIGVVELYGNHGNDGPPAGPAPDGDGPL